MKNCRVRVKNPLREPPARKSSWSVKMHLPIDEAQFKIIEDIIRSLRDTEDNYLIVDLAEPLQKMTFIQMLKYNKEKWLVEVAFDRPIIFHYKLNGKMHFRKHPWTQKKIYVNSVEKAIKIFRQVLCESQVPDMRRWSDCTKQIYLESFNK